MDRGAWWATVHGVGGSQTRLKQLNTHINQREAVGRHREKAAACRPRKGASAGTNPAAISTASLQNCEKVSFSCPSPCSLVLCHGSPTKL